MYRSIKTSPNPIVGKSESEIVMGGMTKRERICEIQDNADDDSIISNIACEQRALSVHPIYSFSSGPARMYSIQMLHVAPLIGSLWQMNLI